MYTVYAFLELLQIVFKIPEVTFFLSNRIYQDPLEKYFGKQRQCGATNDNPNVLQFIKNNDTLWLVGNMWFEDTVVRALVSSNQLKILKNFH